MGFSFSLFYCLIVATLATLATLPYKARFERDGLSRCCFCDVGLNSSFLRNTFPVDLLDHRGLPEAEAEAALVRTQLEHPLPGGLTSASALH